MRQWEELVYARRDGRKMLLIEQTRKKMNKGLDYGQIAEILEEDVDLIKKIYDSIAAHPDYADEEILEDTSEWKS